MARAKRYRIATQNEVWPDEYSSKAAAVKALTEEVKLAASECRRSSRRCTVIGTARKGDVQIRIGGRQGYNLWQRYVIRAQ